ADSADEPISWAASELKRTTRPRASATTTPSGSSSAWRGAPPGPVERPTTGSALTAACVRVPPESPAPWSTFRPLPTPLSAPLEGRRSRHRAWLADRLVSVPAKSSQVVYPVPLSDTRCAPAGSPRRTSTRPRLVPSASRSGAPAAPSAVPTLPRRGEPSTAPPTSGTGRPESHVRRVQTSRISDSPYRHRAFVHVHLPRRRASSHPLAP